MNFQLCLTYGFFSMTFYLLSPTLEYHCPKLSHNLLLHFHSLSFYLFIFNITSKKLLLITLWVVTPFTLYLHNSVNFFKDVPLQHLSIFTHTNIHTYNSIAYTLQQPISSIGAEGLTWTKRYQTSLSVNIHTYIQQHRIILFED